MPAVPEPSSWNGCDVFYRTDGIVDGGPGTDSTAHFPKKDVHQYDVPPKFLHSRH